MCGQSFKKKKSTTEHRPENKHKDAEMWHGGHLWWACTGSSLIQHAIMDQITSSPPQQCFHTCAAPVPPPTAAKTTTFLPQHHKHSPHTCRWVNSENLSMSVSYTRFSSSSAALKDKSQVQTAPLTTVAYSCAVEGRENLSSICWKRWKRQNSWGKVTTAPPAGGDWKYWIPALETLQK